MSNFKKTQKIIRSRARHNTRNRLAMLRCLPDHVAAQFTAAEMLHYVATGQI